ncbi:hypothetical protein BPOR_0213g00040 [Botrytis porri]|uniref:Uncharacterized protein n=1 Tax=Botrytis porri TaxID=87229 RepID=A0A4Z1KNE0_9HELO|nr:hypothetical protein BPOR_0213g00040 [Botrytis porri]
MTFIFAHVCKRNYHNSDTQNLVIEKICLDYDEGMMILKDFGYDLPVSVSQHLEWLVTQASFQAILHIITNAVFVSALIGLGGQFRCTDELYIPVYRSWLMLGFSTLATFGILFAMSAMSFYYVQISMSDDDTFFMLKVV